MDNIITLFDNVIFDNSKSFDQQSEEARAFVQESFSNQINVEYEEPAHRPVLKEFEKNGLLIRVFTTYKHSASDRKAFIPKSQKIEMEVYNG
jgi:hypothetical protein